MELDNDDGFESDKGDECTISRSKVVYHSVELEISQNIDDKQKEKFIS